MLCVHLLGGLVVSWDEFALPAIAGTVPRSLFAYLLTYRDLAALRRAGHPVQTRGTRRR